MRYLMALMLALAATAPSHAEILIGVAGPMTGTYAAFGAQMLQGVQAAVDHLNATGGVEGELLEIATADDACDNRRAEIAAQSLVAKNVSVVIGHYCSNPSLAAAKIYEAAGIPMIAPAATLPALTEAGLANILRLATRDDAQAGFAAKRMKADFPLGKIAVVSDGSIANEILNAQFKATDGAAPELTATIKPESQALDGLIADLQSHDIAALYCACAAADAGLIAKGIGDVGLPVKIYGPDALLVPQFWEKSDVDGEGSLVSFAADPMASGDARKLVKQLAADKISAEAATVQSYAAVELFAAAAEKMGSKNGRGMSDYLHSGASFSTVLGPVSFDDKGDLREPKLVWYVWSKGKFATEYLAK